eukprot:3723213-Prymnesium_polylepis.1
MASSSTPRRASAGSSAATNEHRTNRCVRSRLLLPPAPWSAKREGFPAIPHARRLVPPAPDPLVILCINPDKRVARKKS